MKARRLLCPAVRQLEWETFDLPAELGPRQVLVRAARSLISAGTETAIYAGTHIAYSLPDAKWPRLPMPLGDMLAGTVEVAGSAVTEFKPGDRVAAWSPHSDWAVCDLDSSLVRPIPAGVSFDAAVLALLAEVSLAGVRQARILLGEAVVVFGLGLIGQLAARFSRLSGGWPVIGLDRLPARLDAATANGVLVANPGDQAAARFVSEMTSGRMAEVVIEATGNPAVVPAALDLAAEGGRVVLLGSLRGKIEIDAYSTVHRKGISLIGAHLRLAGGVGGYQTPWTHARNVDLGLSLMAAGVLNVDNLITHHIQPEAVIDMYNRLVERPQDYLGVVIDWNPGP